MRMPLKNRLLIHKKRKRIYLLIVTDSGGMNRPILVYYYETGADSGFGNHIQNWMSTNEIQELMVRVADIEKEIVEEKKKLVTVEKKNNVTLTALIYNRLISLNNRLTELQKGKNILLSSGSSSGIVST